VDSVELADGRVLRVCADVCGKGLQASLTASSLHTLLYATVETETELCRIAERMNRYLCRFLPERSFVTFAGLALDPETGEIECLNAGHPPPLWVSGGQVRSLQSSVNPALGIIDSEMLSERQELAPGDVLLLYSDGVIEAEDAERRPLGAARLAHEFEKTVADLNEASVQTVLESLSKTVSVHRGSLMAADDTTFLVARWQGDQAPPSGITTLIPEPF
jgi:serine phosphatase RsbU (regulator of sigma subunit)